MPKSFSAIMISALFSFLIITPAIAKEVKLNVTSSSFTEGSTIPKKFTADGKDVSPALKWSKPPAGTKVMALTCEDPDAPVGTWFHWIIYNIPAQTSELKENISKMGMLKNGITQGSNDFRKLGYNGPSPPRGPRHRYQFKIFALSDKLTIKAGSSKKDFYKAIKGKVIATGMLTGIYQRQ